MHDKPAIDGGPPGIILTRRTPSRLDLRAPMLLGFAVIAMFFGIGVCGAAFVPIDNGVAMPGTVVAEARTTPVRLHLGGTIATLHVTAGQEVRTGDILATLSTGDLEQQIAVLKSQSEAARRQLAFARDEAATMAGLVDRKLADRTHVIALERQVAEVEKELTGINSRIAVAARDIARAAIRAPVSGRVLSLGFTGPGAVVQPGQVVAELLPDDDRLIVEGHLGPAQIEQLKTGMPAKVWMTSASWRDQWTLKGTLSWISPERVEDKHSSRQTFLARVELTESRAELARHVDLRPGTHSRILLMTGERTLLDLIVDPLMRNLNRAFQG